MTLAPVPARRHIGFSLVVEELRAADLAKANPNPSITFAPVRWIVEPAVTGRGWIAYRYDLSGARTFRTQRQALRYAHRDGAL